MKNIISKEEGLKNLREHFRYFSNGTPDLYSYGLFKDGVTGEEIEEYLMVLINSVNVKSLVKKFNDAFGCQTCRVVIVKGMEVIVYYRHDVIRCAYDVINNRKHYPLD